MPQGRPTLADVAARAGVSAATVSRALHRPNLVAEETREAVWQAVQELGYRPNLIASALMTRRTHTLGLLLPDVRNPFFAQVARSVEDAASRSGYNVIICNSDDRPEKEEAYVDLLRQKGVDGLVVAPSRPESSAVSAAARAGFPVVLLARDLPGSGIPCVRVEDEEGGYRAASYLLELGHRRLAMISEPAWLQGSSERVAGFWRAVREAGLEGEAWVVEAPGSSVEAGAEVTARLLQEGLPSAIFAANDLLAIGVIHAMSRAGRRVPDDCSVVGFDGTMLASVLVPPLTTVVQPVETMTRLALEILEDQLQPEGETRRAEVVRVALLRPTLRPGGSTAPMPGSQARDERNMQ